MEEEVREISEEPLYQQSTAHKHYMALEDSTTAVCTLGCGHGCMIDPESEEIIEGKIVPRRTRG